MATGFQCDTCKRMFIGEPVKELQAGVFKAVYTGNGDICRKCFIKFFNDVMKPKEENERTRTNSTT